MGRYLNGPLSPSLCDGPAQAVKNNSGYRPEQILKNINVQEFLILPPSCMGS